MSTCTAVNGTYHCTLPNGHEGEHRANAGQTIDGRSRSLRWGTSAGERWTAKREGE